MENIFKDSALINLIPLFAAIYLSFKDTKLVLVCIFLGLSIFIFFLIAAAFARGIPNINPRDERKILNETIKKDNRALTGLTSFMQWIVYVITLFLLFPFMEDFYAYILFWLLLVGLLFNLFRFIILNWEIIKSFKE